MGASPSKPSVSRATPPLSEPCSSRTASELAKETRDGARGLAEVLACIPPSVAAGPLTRRLRSALPEDGGNAKFIKDVGNGVVRDTAALNDDGQSQLASVGPESLSFSCQPLGAISDTVLGSSRSAHCVQPLRAKHKVFLSHSGAQKDFVEQLCVDLERMGYFFPFFDQRHHSLPKGQDFAPLIIEAAQSCHVAVIVLSKEFLCSKWPMIELVEFYTAQQNARSGVGKLQLLPLFFKLSIEEIKDEGLWMPIWKGHAACDDRIDLSQWSAAVKALCKSNGLEFGEFAMKEVAYRKCIVESIFKLSPPDFLFGSFESMVGSSRMCEVVSRCFEEEKIVGAKILGVYGMPGLGKTTLAKALHDYFYEEFLGKVCYIDMGHGSRAQRQKWMLKMLYGFEKDAMDCIGDNVEKGLMQMKTIMKRNPVFLILDNITYNAHLLQEVQDYLRMGFHPKSQIMITSSSIAILQDLLPNMESYMPMPTLMFEEAKALFLKRVVPMKDISKLTSEEENILRICVQKCWFSSQEGGSYHPVALIALADYFSRLGSAKGNLLLVWKDHLEKEMVFVKDVLKSSKDLFGILGLQFSTFDFSVKLFFLDLALLSALVSESSVDCYYYDDIGWLCRLHDESLTIITRKLLDLRMSGMINFKLSKCIDCKVEYQIEVPPLYIEFAKWYATDHKVDGLKNAWGVFQLGEMNLRSDYLTLVKCRSNLVRLYISHSTLASVRLIASKRMQELNNLGVLYIVSCYDLTLLNLKGLDCLRHLVLIDLPKLVSITLSKSSSKDKYGGIYDTLQFVQLSFLPSLVYMPDLRLCTSLHTIIVEDCGKVTNFEGADCPCMKDLILYEISLDHFERLLAFKSLQSLEELFISSGYDVDDFQCEWIQRVNESNNGIHVALGGEGPCAKLLEGLHVLLYGSYNMICRSFTVY